jgi:hypothetical protein
LKCGDEITRLMAIGTEKVKLPPVNMGHLLQPTVSKIGRVDGFHILPTTTAPITSASSVTLPASPLRILDSTGAPIVGATVTIKAHRVPTDEFDAFEARVDVADSLGNIIGTSSSKSFFPQSWTAVQIQTGIYAAYTMHFLNGGAPFFTRMALVTPEGVKIEMKVTGNQSSQRLFLKQISTAYLIQGQVLDRTHVCRDKGTP